LWIPYNVLGSPKLPGVNAVRPFYEAHVILAKPYQVQRIKPAAIALGSSRAEVGLDPGHPGWADKHTFNFGMPASTSYEVMRAFLHAQAVGRPLKQAVAGLDFFAFNIFFPRSQQQQEASFAGGGDQDFANFLTSELAKRSRNKPVTPQAMPAERTPALDSRGELIARPEEEIPEHYKWNEALYLAVNPDVAAAVDRKLFKSGREHYELAGRVEGRISGMVPSSWNEEQYLATYPDVAAEVRKGKFISGYHHYLVAGRAEGRGTGIPPRGWNEALYLRLNPDVQAEIARGTFKSGYHHYLAAGRAEGRKTGMPPPDWNDDLYLRIYPDVAAEVRRGTFVNGYHHYLVAGRAEGRSSGIPPKEWDEELYLRINPDVRAEIERGTFLNGYHHYLAAGRSEHRKGGLPPHDWDESGYLQVNPDVAQQVKVGAFLSGYHHYLLFGRLEQRAGGFRPTDWNEARYLAVNPEVRAEIALGAFHTGYIHYIVIGRRKGLVGGFPPADPIEALRIRSPRVNKIYSEFGRFFDFFFSATAVGDSLRTILLQSKPATFDERGVRIFGEQDAAVRKQGGVGKLIRVRLSGGGWGPWFTPPKLAYCFTNTDTGMTMFEPYRFMLRRAYAEGVDLRLFASPLLAVNRTLLEALGMGKRYDFWLKEIVRINEEEAARAGKPPLPLWDFSDVNSITREPVPPANDPRPMRGFWEHSHYRMSTGNLILDRILGYTDATRRLPADFGVRLTSANIDAHIAHTKEMLHAWGAANSELVDPIVRGAKTLKSRIHQAEVTCW
jgi:hypothetical protein